MASTQGHSEIQIDLFGTWHKALIIPSLTPSELVRSIIEEFREIEHLNNEANAYRLAHAGSQELLDNERSLLQQLGKFRQVRLLEYMPPLPNGASSINQHIYLREQSRNSLYKLNWQPAIIGRIDENLSQNELVAVNLASHGAGLRISRRHAQITAPNGQILLEPLSANATRIRREATIIEVKSSEPLQAGDVIDLARGQILLRVIVRPLQQS
jgi:hypothetical protein